MVMLFFEFCNLIFFFFLDKAEELEVPEIKTYLAKYRDFTDKIASMFKKLADDFTDDKVDEISTGKYFKDYNVFFRFYINFYFDIFL